MGKVSFAYKDFAKGGGFGLQAGRYEVIDARAKVYQPAVNSKTHEQADPFVCAELDVVKLDDKWNRISDDIIQHQFPLAFTQDEDGKKVIKVRPGKAAGPDDDEPEDLCKGKDEVAEMVDIEGNCFIADDGYRPWNQSPYALFMESLEQKGFKSEILSQGYLPGLVGMKFSCIVKELPKPKNWKKVDAPTALVATEINVFPYEIKGGGSKASSKKESAKGTNGTANGAGQGVAGANGTDLFDSVVKKFVAKNKGKKLTREQFRIDLGKELMAVKEIGIKNAGPLVKQHISNDENFATLTMQHGLELDAETFEVQL